MTVAITETVIVMACVIASTAIAMAMGFQIARIAARTTRAGTNCRLRPTRRERRTRYSVRPEQDFVWPAETGSVPSPNHSGNRMRSLSTD
jgi:hypothetical protein